MLNSYPNLNSILKFPNKNKKNVEKIDSKRTFIALWQIIRIEKMKDEKKMIAAEKKWIVIEYIHLCKIGNDKMNNKIELLFPPKKVYVYPSSQFARNSNEMKILQDKQQQIMKEKNEWITFRFTWLLEYPQNNLDLRTLIFSETFVYHNESGKKVKAMKLWFYERF